MSETIKRFDPIDYHDGESLGCMEESVDGDYVKIEDYEKLQKELATLKSLRAHNLELNEKFHASKDAAIESLNVENTKLHETLDKFVEAAEPIRLEAKTLGLKLGNCIIVEGIPALIKNRDKLKKLLNWAVGEISKNSCQHEETHRGGAIWTICDQCGRKWADDEGGFEPYEEPKELTEAFELLK